MHSSYSHRFLTRRSCITRKTNIIISWLSFMTHVNTSDKIQKVIILRNTQYTYYIGHINESIKISSISLIVLEVYSLRSVERSITISLCMKGRKNKKKKNLELSRLQANINGSILVFVYTINAHWQKKKPCVDPCIFWGYNFKRKNKYYQITFSQRSEVSQWHLIKISVSEWASFIVWNVK